MKKKIISILLIAFILIGYMGKMSVDVLATSKKITEAEEKEKDLKNKQDDVTKRINETSDKINNVKMEMESVQEKINSKLVELSEQEGKLAQAKIDCANQLSGMKARIKYSYEGGSVDLINSILEAKSIGDIINKVEYVSSVSSYDRDKYTEYKEIQDSIQIFEKQVRKEYDELAILKSEVLTKQETLVKMIKEQEAVLEEINYEVESNQSELEELKKLQAEEIEEAKRAAEEAARLAYSGSATYGVAGESVESGTGIFSHPCPAYTSVSSPVGFRTFDNSYHKGVDFSAPAGTPIYAAEGGTVIISGWSDSAGNWIVINHGNGIVTKYMHCTSLFVRAGETVVRGQNIGTVGNTGNSYGDHLHFQTEVNGSVVDGMDYL